MRTFFHLNSICNIYIYLKIEDSFFVDRSTLCISSEILKQTQLRVFSSLFLKTIIQCIVPRKTIRRGILMEQERRTLPEHIS